MIWLRSLIFTTIMFLSALPWATAVDLLAPFPIRWRLEVARSWAFFVLWNARFWCGLKWEVEGLENVPEQNTVLLWKHQSAFETFVQLVLFPKQSIVVKRELTWIPIFGWGLYAIRAISINRGSGGSAVRQLVRQGRERLESGFWVVIFPEGTRVPPGTTRRYGVGGALLAQETGRPVVPVAHNAGDFWPRRGLTKRPGTVKIVIGPPISTADKSVSEINAEAQAWVEGTMHRISDRYPQAHEAPEAVAQ